MSPNQVTDSDFPRQGYLFFDKRNLEFDLDLEELVDLDEEDKEERTLNCKHCGYRITNVNARISISERHAHTFTNPHGFIYRIGCFCEAPGVVPDGPPSNYWSWFPGYQWQIELCKHCMIHMGWHFKSDDDHFYGLILDRLVESSADEHT